MFRIFFFGKLFLPKFFRKIFFGENFSFHKNVSAKIFFTIFSGISFVFDVCEIMYFANFFIQNFAYCEFFCFAILVYGKKNCKFFLRFLFQRWTWIPNLNMFLFWKKANFLWSYFWIYLLTIRKITVLRDEQRTRKIQNNMKSTTGYLEEKNICMHKGLSERIMYLIAKESII